MKTNIHRAQERGKSDHGWLKSAFSFSFADYFNRNRMGFGVLRVVNDDVIAPNSGFPMHPHGNMEIVTIVTAGAVEHEDSMGSRTVIKSGEVQRMSAGSGLVHSERNPSDTETLELFQIWIQTAEKDIEPEYEQAPYSLGENRGRLLTLVSGDSEIEGLTFHQNAWIKRGVFSAGDRLDIQIGGGNGLFVLVVEGGISLSGEKLHRRDSVEISDADFVGVIFEEDSDILVIEVPLVA